MCVCGWVCGGWFGLVWVGVVATHDTYVKHPRKGQGRRVSALRTCKEAAAAAAATLATVVALSVPPLPLPLGPHRGSSPPPPAVGGKPRAVGGGGGGGMPICFGACIVGYHRHDWRIMMIMCAWMWMPHKHIYIHTHLHVQPRTAAAALPLVQEEDEGGAEGPEGVVGEEAPQALGRHLVKWGDGWV